MTHWNGSDVTHLHITAPYTGLQPHTASDHLYILTQAHNYRDAIHSMHFHVEITSLTFQLIEHTQLNFCTVY